ncbi:6,7-dimethyl-8-ribityllumazine synthase, partial|nr:6,7-dimethyl-8-ribityllumazine synthase [Escherichia coli]
MNNREAKVGKTEDREGISRGRDNKSSKERMMEGEIEEVKSIGQVKEENINVVWVNG